MNLAPNIHSNPTTSGSPEDDPMRIETGRYVMPRVNEASSSRKKKRSKVKRPKKAYENRDKWLVALTYYQFRSNNSFKPWNLSTWDAMGPKWLLTRHSNESLKNYWAKYFAKLPDRIKQLKSTRMGLFTSVQGLRCGKLPRRSLVHGAALQGSGILPEAVFAGAAS